MLSEREIKLGEAAELLEKCGLNPVDCADYRVGLFTEEEDRLVATGALVGDVLQMIAVDPERQGEELALRVVSHLISQAVRRGLRCVYLITKSVYAGKFVGMGFKLVADVPDGAALLEWGRPGIEEYCKAMAAFRGVRGEKVGCLVMNCNPFTLGHQYLISRAAEENDRVFVFILEEDVSAFPFSIRKVLAARGTAGLENVTVTGGGRYMVSSLTFPAYFSRDAVRSRQQAELDAEIFDRFIVPALGITKRYLGEEPLSESTEIYNRVLSERIKDIRVEIVPRLCLNGEPVSASRVRGLLKAGDEEKAYQLLPDTTRAYIKQNLQQVKQWLMK